MSTPPPPPSDQPPRDQPPRDQPPGYGSSWQGRPGQGGPGYVPQDADRQGPADGPPGPGNPYATPYANPYGSAYAATREHPQGTTILVLGVLSLVACGLLGPVAWVMGNSAIGEIDRAPAAYSNRGMVQAGRICGIVASALVGFVVAGMLLLLIAGAAASS